MTVGGAGLRPLDFAAANLDIREDLPETQNG